MLQRNLSHKPLTQQAIALSSMLQRNLSHKPLTQQAIALSSMLQRNLSHKPLTQQAIALPSLPCYNETSHTNLSHSKPSPSLPCYNETSHTASHRPPLFHADGTITQSAYYLQRVYNYISRKIIFVYFFMRKKNSQEFTRRKLTLCTRY